MKTISSPLALRALSRPVARYILPLVATLASTAALAQPVTLNLPDGYPHVPIAGTVLNWTDNFNDAVPYGFTRWYGDVLTVQGPEGVVYSDFAASLGGYDLNFRGNGVWGFNFELPVTLNPNTAYTWQVTMYNGIWGEDFTAKAIYTSPPASFTTTSAPNIQLVSPTEWTGVPLNTAFTWDAVPGATSYELKVWIPYGSVVIDTTVNGTSYQPGNSLLYCEWYYWSVRAIYNGANSTFDGPWAPNWWFRTVSLPGPYIPSPYVPVIKL